MKKLLKYIKEYTKESILSPLFKLLEASFELFVPLVMAAIIDKGIDGGDKGYIVRMCLLLVLLGAVGLVCSLTAQFYAAKAATGFAYSLRGALFSHIQSFSFTELDELGTPAIITRMTSDISRLQTGVNLFLRLLLRSPFVVFGAMFMAVTVDAKSALIFAATIAVLSVVVFAIIFLCLPLYGRVQSYLDKILSSARENLSGARVIRAFGMESAEKRAFLRKNEEMTKAQKLAGKISALMNPITYMIINLAVVALIHTGALRVYSGNLTQGEVVALYSYMLQILVELIKLANLIITVTRALASGNRVASILEIPPAAENDGDTLPADGYEYAVEFRGVSLRYKGASDTAIESISFKAKKGETIGIIGGTGSGKSTLVNLIPRFYEATEGSVLVNGADVKTIFASSLRGNIGVVPQKAVLFRGSIRENIRWGKPDASDREIARAVETAQAGDVVSGKKGGLDHMIEQNGRNLSGGQRQRLTIARALVRRPEILILDDSASALDLATDAALRRAIEGMEGTTVFIVSQRARSVLHADRIIVLDDGRAVGIGTHGQLYKTCPVYREIYSSQYGSEDLAQGGDVK